MEAVLKDGGIKIDVMKNIKEDYKWAIIVLGWFIFIGIIAYFATI